MKFLSKIILALAMFGSMVQAAGFKKLGQKLSKIVGCTSLIALRLSQSKEKKPVECSVLPISRHLNYDDCKQYFMKYEKCQNNMEQCEILVDKMIGKKRLLCDANSDLYEIAQQIQKNLGLEGVEIEYYFASTGKTDSAGTYVIFDRTMKDGESIVDLTFKIVFCSNTCDPEWLKLQMKLCRSISVANQNRLLYEQQKYFESICAHELTHVIQFLSQSVDTQKAGIHQGADVRLNTQFMFAEPNSLIARLREQQADAAAFALHSCYMCISGAKPDGDSRISGEKYDLSRSGYFGVRELDLYCNARKLDGQLCEYHAKGLEQAEVFKRVLQSPPHPN